MRSENQENGKSLMFVEDHVEAVESLHVCPACAKMFLEEKTLYLHIMRAHQDGQRLAYDLRADLYRRWQERIPRRNQ
jgi:hypothetical protein